MMKKGCKMSGEIRRKERIIELDYIRAFAILCVLLTHTTRTTHHSVPQPSPGSPAPYRSHVEGFFHPRPKQR